MENKPFVSVRAPAVALAAVVGFVTVVVAAAIHSVVTGAKLNLADELPILLFQMLLVATPFFLLAIMGIKARLPWLVGLVLTAAFWGFYLYESLSHHGDGTGANIGLGLLMLVSPVIISACSLAAGHRHIPRHEPQWWS